MASRFGIASRARLLVAGLGLLPASSVVAEPWLSTRFAQNCAACHAPGRVNVVTPGRGCTLSCQGCHVNPSGGGLRSAYGKWTEDRWLASFRSKMLGHQRAVQPTAQQKYAKWYRDAASVPPAAEGKRVRPPVLATTAEPSADESDYARDGREFVVADDQADARWLVNVPAGDPYLQSEMARIEAGADARWQYQDMKVNDEPSDADSFLMTVDFGARYRPLGKSLSLVYEARFLGDPKGKTSRADMFRRAETRSLYALADRLPYNSFVQAGYYKPLFGSGRPDHYSLGQLMTTFAMTGQPSSYKLRYNAVSLGTAPNVPYLQLHWIGDRADDPTYDSRGFALNSGLRFVTLGASVNYSYWRTKDRAAGEQSTDVELHSVSFAARLGRLIASLEGVSLARDTKGGKHRQGGVVTLDTQTKLWREIYYTLQLAQANTSMLLEPGSSTQIETGVRAFLIPGLDLMLAYETLRDQTRARSDTPKRTLDTRSYQGQVHVYF